eukprot:m.352154 g.352154  ORF g.352154 m.352154 type:complete len:84 (+) comp57369_c0_seq1:151-402(+)
MIHSSPMSTSQTMPWASFESRSSCHSTVQKLDLSNTQCDANGARHIADMLSNSLVPSNIHTMFTRLVPWVRDTSVKFYRALSV